MGVEARARNNAEPSELRLNQLQFPQEPASRVAETSVFDTPTHFPCSYTSPRYVRASKTASFTTYANAGFSPANQQRLRDAFVELDRRDCHLLLSNNDAHQERVMYAGYHIKGGRSTDCVAALAYQ